MDARTLSPAAHQIEALFGGRGDSTLLDFLREEPVLQGEAMGSVPSSYDLLARLGHEVFGPKPQHVGTYSNEILYGAAGSAVVRFRSAIRTLKARADRTGSVSPDEVEYGHQAALVWAEIGRLKEFIGTSAVISELIAELRTARFQFLGKDTPTVAMQAVASALRLIAEAQRLDTSLVDRVVEVLEAGGIDSLAPDALRDSDG